LAAAFLAGEWSPEALRTRAGVALAARPRWLPGLCRRVIERWPQQPAEVRHLALELERDPMLRAAFRRRPGAWRIQRWFLPEPRMAVISGPPARWPILARC
jgi:hypothetical protein